MRLIGTARDRPPVDLAGIDRCYLRMPMAMPGMVIGLFGGSFNPPHSGHALVAETALRRLNLDRLWWMVTPGNPLKSRNQLAPLAERLAESEATAPNPRIDVTAFEAITGAGFTADTLAHIRQRHPAVRFVWIMGADSLAGFHRWQRWQEIAHTFPIAIIDRPGSTLAFLSSRMTKTFDHARVDEDDAALLPYLDPPAWTFIHGPRSALSSTEIPRGAGGRSSVGRVVLAGEGPAIIRHHCLQIVFGIAALVTGRPVADLKVGGRLPGSVDEVMRAAAGGKTGAVARRKLPFALVRPQRRIAGEDVDELVLLRMAVQQG